MSFVAMLIAASGAAQAPSGPWNIEEQDNLCLLSRPYGDAAHRTIIGFQPTFDRGALDLIVITPPVGAADRDGTATIERSPDGTKLKGEYFSALVSDGKVRFTRISVEPAMFDKLATTTELRIRAGPVDQTVQIVHFEKAKPAFRKCEDDLLRSWGVDPASVAEKRAAALPADVKRYFRTQSYPDAAMAHGNVGRITVVLNVDAAGRVAGCRVVAGAGKVLNDATCARAMSIPLTPGRDSTGKAAPSIAILRAKWTIGD